MPRYFRNFAILLVILAPAIAQARAGGAGPAPATPPATPPAITTPAPGAATPAGLWMTANGDAIIQIAPCGAGICGDIAGLFLAPGEPTPRDWAGSSQCRLTILQARRAGDSGQAYWIGSIVNPRDGAAYNAILRVNAQNQLLLRGYIGLPLFGETQIWTRYHGTLADNCRQPQPLG